MNERIQELAKQAGDDWDHTLESDKEFLKKFAELIVKECMTQCDKVEHDDELSNYEGGFRDGALLCYLEIRDHFGVEE